MIGVCVRRYVRSWKFVGGLGLGLVSGVFAIVLPVVAGNLIETEETSRRYALGGGLIALLILQPVVAAVANYLLTSRADDEIYSLRCSIFGRMIRYPISFYDGNRSGDLASNVINDLGMLRNFISQTLPQALTGAFVFIGAELCILRIDPIFSILVLLVLACGFLILIPVGALTRRINGERQQALSCLMGNTTEFFQSMRTVKTNLAEQQVSEQFRESARAMRDADVKADKFLAYLGPLQNALEIAMLAVLLAYSGMRVFQGVLGVGDLAALMLYFFQMTGPINNLLSLYGSLQATRGSLMHLESYQTNLDERVLWHKGGAFAERDNVSGITLDNVSFAYGQDTVLHDVNITIPLGRKTAFIGVTGIGKSTLLSIIDGLYVEWSGGIYCNDMSIRDCPLDQWRAKFGVVLQDSAILTGTIADNLTFGLAAKPTEETLMQVVHAMKLDDIVSSRDGLLTQVGEDGMLLSGGQRQRIQIARALLREPEVLILDEATANIDTQTEHDILRSIDSYRPGMTIIAVTHRLTTLNEFDKVFRVSHEGISTVKDLA